MINCSTLFEKCVGIYWTLKELFASVDIFVHSVDATKTPACLCQSCDNKGHPFEGPAAPRTAPRTLLALISDAATNIVILKISCGNSSSQ